MSGLRGSGCKRTKSSEAKPFVEPLCLWLSFSRRIHLALSHLDVSSLLVLLHRIARRISLAVPPHMPPVVVSVHVYPPHHFPTDPLHLHVSSFWTSSPSFLSSLSAQVQFEY